MTAQLPDKKKVEQMDNQKNQQIQKKVRGETPQWNFLLTFALPIMLLLLMFLFAAPVKADPSGATIDSNITATAATVLPDNRTDAGGTINTLTLNTIQQDSNWKAYVGNISGMLTLDDADGFTIYQWALGNAEVTGELYVSRSDNITWSTINCSNESLIETEQTLMGFAASSVDDINKTFNYTTHNPITVAGRTIDADTCRSTSTFVSDAAQNIASADFPEMLLASETNMIYVSPLNDDANSYATGQTMDFQMIVPDDVTVASTTYYFYIELGS
jgi:hypothetical protein